MYMIQHFAQNCWPRKWGTPARYWVRRAFCRLEVGDTAGWKPALHFGESHAPESIWASEPASIVFGVGDWQQMGYGLACFTSTITRQPRFCRKRAKHGSKQATSLSAIRPVLIASARVPTCICKLRA